MLPGAETAADRLLQRNAARLPGRIDTETIRRHPQAGDGTEAVRVSR